MESRLGKTRTATWSSIPDDILALIAGKIISAYDYVSLSSVCRSWYIFVSETYDTSEHELNLVPLYMSVAGHSNLTEVRNPASGNALVLDSPETAGRRIWGSPFGWLLAFDRTDLPLSLFNPFTGATIPLPPLPRSAFWYENPGKLKVFLTASPDLDPKKCLVVMVSTRNQMVFTRPHRHSRLWSRVQDRFDLISLAYHKGKLYGLESSSSSRVGMFLFNLNHSTREQRQVDPRAVESLTLNLTPYIKKCTLSEEYLFDLNGQLCLFTRSGTKLFKIDVSTEGFTQVQLPDDHSLFLDNYYAFSCKVKQHRHKVRDLEYPFRVKVRGELGYNNNKVYSITNSPNPLHMPFWTVPCLKFSKLESIGGGLLGSKSKKYIFHKLEDEELV